MKLFLDANVLIDFILERPKFYPAAAMIISYAVEGKIRICVSSMSIVTSCFICVERCDMELADFRKKIDFLREYLEICSVDESDIYNSYDAKWKDFEDGVQYYSAKRNGADCLVTRNTKDFEENGLRVLDADEACLLLLSKQAGGCPGG